jgi:para-aminobenzoate synthetase/4-amino-4-deoxychorismate lyase
MPELALIEALLWNGSYQRLEQHLARLERSARQLGIPLAAGDANDALEKFAQSFEAGTPLKVRLVLGADSSIQVDAGPLGNAAPGTVKLAASRVDSRDPLLQHKTTRRSLFDAAGRTADKLGLADLIFLNERGQVTEGSRNNVFVERDGRLLTPPVESGLLPGVCRESVLTARAVEVRPLEPPDLLEADAVFLTNSVRGWRQVRFLDGVVSIG